MPMQGPILIIEDDSQDAENMVAALQDLGVKNELKTFQNAPEALQYLLAAAIKPLLIICDIKMGGLDGLSFRRQIISDARLEEKSVPFVFFTCLQSPSIVNEAYKLDIQGFFEKPQTYQQLKEYLLTIVAYWQRSQHPA